MHDACTGMALPASICQSCRPPTQLSHAAAATVGGPWCCLKQSSFDKWEAKLLINLSLLTQLLRLAITNSTVLRTVIKADEVSVGYTSYISRCR